MIAAVSDYEFLGGVVLVILGLIAVGVVEWGVRMLRARDRWDEHLSDEQCRQELADIERDRPHHIVRR